MSIMRPEGGWNVTRKPVHPGEMLGEEFMKPLGISINALALELHVPVTRISEIVNERRGITADTALRLARYFGTSADFWMNLQKDYELLVTRKRSFKTIQKQVRRRGVAA
jgi:addiction module HigA family antidote